MINDPKESHTRRPLPPIQSSHQRPTVIENPLDNSSDNSDDPTNTSNKHSRIILPPPFYTKRPKRLPNMTRLKVILKRKKLLYLFTNKDNKTANTSALKDSILPCYSTVNPNPNDYPLNSQSLMKMKVLSKSIVKQINNWSF